MIRDLNRNQMTIVGGNFNTYIKGDLEVTLTVVAKQGEKILECRK